MDNNKLPLQAAEVQWVNGKHNNQWRLTNNDETLLFLSGGLKHNEIGDLLQFMQRHEKNAYDIGMEDGKTVMLAVNSQKMKELLDEVLLLKHMNEDLSNKLKAIIEREA